MPQEMLPGASSSSQGSRGEKRKSSVERHDSQKQQKCSNLIEFMRETECSAESDEKLTRLLESCANVNDKDETEKCTPLLYCVRKRKLSWVPLLLEYGADPSLTKTKMEDGTARTASDLSWENQDYDVVFQLIMAGGPYPKNFDETKLSQGQKNQIKRRLAMVQTFHGLIRNNKLDAVKNFVDKHPEEYAYNKENKCALLIALESGNTEMYTLLQSKGFLVGIKDKKSVNNQIIKHFKGPSLVDNLVSKSRFWQDNNEVHVEIARECFEALSKIPEMEDILALVESNNVKITFDFNDETVCRMDPSNPNPADGRTYGRRGEIFVAAKMKNEDELLGTLAHELTHFAMYLIYNNNHQPYRENSENEKTFKTVEDACYKLKAENETIRRAFENYSANEFHAELIVRVPQLIVLHSNNSEELAKHRKTFKVLFDFYEDYVAPDLKAEVALKEPKQKVRELNKFFAQLDTLSSMKMRYESKIDKLTDINEKSMNVFVETKTPDMTMASLVANLLIGSKEFVESKNIFVETKQLHENYLSMVQPLIESKLKPTIYVLDSSDFDASKGKLILSQLAQENSRIVFVTSKSYEDFEESFPSSFKYNITFAWDDLTKDAESELRDSKFVFQEKEIPLETLLSKNLNVLRSCPVEEVLKFKNSNLDVSSKFLPEQRDQTSSKVFIERQFEMSENRQKTPLNSDEVVKKLTKERCVIIADSAGMGKTTSAIEFAKSLKEQNPMSWVVFMDLKQHTSAFLKDDEPQPSKLGAEFFSQEILKLHSTFQQKLFEDFYQKSKVIFIIDGIDEISPRFKEFVLNMTKFIKKTENLLLVTTRTHLQQRTENKLGRTAIKLKPFNESNQMDFLIEFWKNKAPDSAPKALKKKAETLLKKFKKIFNHRDFVEVPLQLYMMAVVFESAKEITDDRMNLFSLFKQFVAKKFRIWSVEKGEIAEEESFEMDYSDTPPRQLHLKLAIESIFGVTMARDLKILESEITRDREMIERIGLVRLAVNDVYEFEHKTYAEFLIAEYCFANITTKTFDLSVDMFLKVFLESDYENIRKFINDKLQLATNQQQNGIMWPELAARLSQKENHFLVGKLVAGKHINLAVFVLQTERINKEAKLDFVKHPNKYSGNALHRAMGHTGFFKTLWSCIESFTDDGDQKELFRADIGKENNILMRASCKQNDDVLKFVLEVMQRILDETEFIEMVTQKQEGGQSILVEGAKVQDSSTFEIFWTAIEAKLSEPKKLQALLFSKNEGVLAAFLNNPRVIKSVLETIEKPLETSELCDFLTKDDWLVGVLGFFAFKAEVGAFSTLWDFIERNFDPAYQKKLLTQRFQNFVGIRNALADSCCNINISSRKFIFKIARELLTLEEFRTDLMTPDALGLVAFHHSLMFGKSRFFIEDYEQEFVVPLTKAEIRDMLMSKDFSEERNLLHVFCGYSVVHNTTWNFILTTLEKEEISEMLFKKDSKELNVFSCATVRNAVFLITILEWLKENYSQAEVLKAMFKERSNNQCTLLHLLAYNGGVNLCRKFFDFLYKCKFGNDMLRSIILERDIHEQIPLLCLLECETLDVIPEFWIVYEKVLRPEEMLDMIDKVSKSLSQHTEKEKPAADFLKNLFQTYRKSHP